MARFEFREIRGLVCVTKAGNQVKIFLKNYKKSA